MSFISSATTFKASAAFLGFFGAQFLAAPDFLMSENFQGTRAPATRLLLWLLWLLSLCVALFVVVGVRSSSLLTDHPSLSILHDSPRAHATRSDHRCQYTTHQGGEYALDRWHYFFMRGAGSAFLGLAMFYWTAANEADKYMLGSTLTFALTSAMLPYYAQQNLPVNMPKHLIPVVGCSALLMCHLSCLMNKSKKD